MTCSLASSVAQEEAKQAAENEATAAKTEDAAKPDGEEPPATATVQKGTIKITLDLDGTFVAPTSEEIVVRPEEWGSSGPLTIESVAKHGARVKRGEVVITFDTTKIDRAIEDLRAELKLGELSLQQAEQGLQALEETTPIDLKANERTAQRSEEDRKYYFDKQRPFDLKSTEYSLRASQNSLEYAEEELKQLEKMYEADDLTEETEAIVLKRARNSVESAKMSLESAQMRHDFALKYSIPREDESVRESSQRTRLQTLRTGISLPLALEKQRLEVAKLNQQRLRSEEKLKKLEADREALTIKSPLDGIVYYGKCVHGKFTDAVTQSETLRPHGNVQPNQVLMTIAQPQPLSVLVTVPEEKVYRLRIGLTGKATPKAYPDLELPVVVSQFSPIPLGPGKFEAELKVTRDKQAEAIVPGLACTVQTVPYLKQNALYVPPKAVRTDEKTGESYVEVVGKDGKAQRRAVTVGEKTDKQAEIVKGLTAGEKVLLEATKDQK
ncbi:MAG: hypothetical protein JJ992_26455 [Planctomycetes bacterium]|nr:hypothetical protein [Planctomycetota bacterium]